MTPAQKKNAERFKKAISEAKKLRKKNPKLTQAQAVKQAYAILYKTEKVGATKKTPTKKKTVKKKIAKKSTAKNYHKDTKSHNVRISVVSGTNNDVLEQIKYHKKWIEYHTKGIKLEMPYKHYPEIAKSIKVSKQKLQYHKKSINSLKKFI